MPSDIHQRLQWAWAQNCAGSSEKMVLANLATRGDGATSIPSICSETSLNEKTVRKALRWLSGANLIERRERSGDSYVFRLPVAAAAPDQAPLPAPEAAPEPHKAPLPVQASPPADSGIPPLPVPAPQPLPNLPPSKEVSKKVSKEEETPNGVSISCEAGFSEFWLAYPRKLPSRVSALKSWSRAVRNGAKPDEIMAGLRRYQFEADSRYQPHATTWLNQEYWTSVSEPRGVVTALNPQGVPKRRTEGFIP